MSESVQRERKRDEARKALQKHEKEKHKRKCEAVDRASRELERKKTADEELLKIIWNEVKVSLQEVATGHEAADLTRRVSDVKEASKYGLVLHMVKTKVFNAQQSGIPSTVPNRK